MSDVFFSYSSVDRDRVVLAFQALTTQQIDVFWDQTLPPGSDWDEWIRGHLGRAKVVVVFWTRTSIKSPNVKDEAYLASNQLKLIPVILDELSDGELPLGLGTKQCANLIEWKGNSDDPHWERLVHEIEDKIVPLIAKLRIAQEIRRADSINERAIRSSQLAEERHNGLMTSLQKTEGELTATRIDGDLLTVRLGALESQVTSERAHYERTSAELIGRISSQESEISDLRSRTNESTIETIRQQRMQIITLEKANETLQQRLFQTAQAESKKLIDQIAEATIQANLDKAEQKCANLSSELMASRKSVEALSRDLEAKDTDLRNAAQLSKGQVSEFEETVRLLQDKLNKTSPNSIRNLQIRFRVATLVALALTSSLIGLSVMRWEDAKSTTILREKMIALEKDKASLLIDQNTVLTSTKVKGAENRQSMLELVKVRRELAEARNDVAKLNSQVTHLTSENSKLLTASREPLEPTSRAQSTIALVEQVRPASLGQFTVVVASERNRESAHARLVEFENCYPDITRKWTIEFRETDVPDKGVWYRVTIGSFDTMDEARNACLTMRKSGLRECFASSHGG